MTKTFLIMGLFLWLLVTATTHASRDDQELTTDITSAGLVGQDTTTNSNVDTTPLSDCCKDYLASRNATPAITSGEAALPPYLRGEGLLSEDEYLRLIHAVTITVVPIILLGIVTNSLSILAYMRMPASVISTYFCLSSGLDILYMLMVFPTTFISLVMGQTNAAQSVFYIYYVNYILNYVTNTTRKVIVCVTMLMSLDRYLVVAFPIRIRSLEHFRRPRLYTFIVAVCAYLFDMNLAFKNKVMVTDRTVQIVPTQTLAENQQLFLDFALTSSIIFQYTPLALLVLFNTLLVVALARHSRNMKKKFGAPDHAQKRNKQVSRCCAQREDRDGQSYAISYPGQFESNQKRKSADVIDTRLEGSNAERQKSVTRTVLVHSFIFTMLVLPNTLYPLIKRFIPGFYVLGREHYLVMAMGTVFVLLDTVNSAMNFVVYFTTGSAFRAEVFSLFGKRVGQGRQATTRAISQSSVLSTPKP